MGDHGHAPPERIELERAVLGSAIIEAEADWNRNPEGEGIDVNLAGLLGLCESLADRVRDRLVTGESATESELRLYDDVVLFLIYYRVQPLFRDLILRGSEAASGRVGFYRDFVRETEHYFGDSRSSDAGSI